MELMSQASRPKNGPTFTPFEMAQMRKDFEGACVVDDLTGPVGEALFEDALSKAQVEGADSHWSLLS